MPTISTVSAGAVGAFGVSRDANKTVTTLTDVEIIHDYAVGTPTSAPTDGRLYVTRIVGGSTQTTNFYDFLTFYYEPSLTTAITNCIIKIKGDRYFLAAANGIISELIPTLGWSNYRYTADWEGVDIDNPAWIGELTSLGEVPDEPNWAGVKILNTSWSGVLKNTLNWAGELVENTSGWIAPLIDNPNPDWEGPLINNDNWLGVLVNNPDSAWEAPLINNPNWVQTYSENPNWEAPLINNPNWVQTYSENPNWTAPLINNPDPTWEDPVINNPNWSGEPIYDEDNNIIGYDTSNPQLSNGGLIYEGRTEANLGLIREGRTVPNQGLIPDIRNEANQGLIREGRTVPNQGLIPDIRNEANQGLIREGRNEANGGLVRDTTVSRTYANGGLIHEGRTEANGGLIREGRTEANEGLVRDTRYPSLQNGGQYYDLLEPRSSENGGFFISYADQFRTIENGGLLYDLNATRTLANNGIIHSTAGEYRTVENGGLIYQAPTIENGAFIKMWVPWFIELCDSNGNQTGQSVTAYTQNSSLVGSKLFYSKSITAKYSNQNISSSLFNQLIVASDNVVYNRFGLFNIQNGFAIEDNWIIGAAALLYSELSRPTVGSGKLYRWYASHIKANEDTTAVFFDGAKLDTNLLIGGVVNATNGSYEKYRTNSQGIIRDASRFDGEYWYSFDSAYTQVLKNNSSYTIELFVKPDLGNAAKFNFVPPYNSYEIAREAEMGILSVSNGTSSNTKWVLSIAPNKYNDQNYFKFERKNAGAEDVFIIPITYNQGSSWQHIAITHTHETGIVSFYLNGTLICKTTQNNNALMDLNATLDVGVRESVIDSVKSGVFNGRIKDLRIVAKNIYSTGQTTGQITVPNQPLQPYGYGQNSYWTSGSVDQNIYNGELVLLTLKMDEFLYGNTPPSIASQGIAQSNRPTIKNVKIVGLYAQKVLIEYELESYKLITKTYISLQKNVEVASPVPGGEPELNQENYELFNKTTVYPGNRSSVTVLEEMDVVPERIYHFSIIVASSAGTAQSNIYYFKTPSL